MKKLILSLLIPCAILLVGCAENPKITNDLKPSTEALADYSEEGISLLQNDFLTDDNITYASNMLGTEPLPINMKTVNGDDFNIKDFKGKDFVILIEKTSCPSCRENLPIVNKVLKENKDVQLLSVFYADEVSAIDEVYKELNVDSLGTALTSKRENSSKFLEDYKVTQVPTLLFVDKNFKISNIHIGTLDEQIFKDKLKVAFENDKKLYEYKK